LEELKERVLTVQVWNEYFQNKYSTQKEFVIDHYSRKIVFSALRAIDIKTAIEYSKMVNLDNRENMKTKYLVKILRWFGRLRNLFSVN
jgi:hypothetical protein